MNISANNTDGQRLWYLAAAYSKYPHGLEAAFEFVAREAGLLIRNKIAVFSPIAHTHPVAIHAGMDPLDHTIWLPCDEPMMKACTGIIRLRMESWEKSYGMRVELDAFTAAGKDVVWMTPGEVPAEFLAGGRFHCG